MYSTLLKVCDGCNLKFLAYPHTHAQLLLIKNISSDFESIVSLVNKIMVENENAVFYTTYQERRSVN
jgi:hypothetical protein